MHARALALPAISILAFLSFAALREWYPELYYGLLKILIKVPVTYPFADWDWNASVIRCWAQGVNTYVENPCFDFWPRSVHNYSPLWLRMPFLGTEPYGSLIVAVGVCLIFFLSLAALPAAASAIELCFMALALLSSSTLLAVERGNTELLIFVLLVLAVRLATSGFALRLVGYALITFTGLLKFYPMVALWVALKERLPVVLAVGTASVMALAVLVFLYHEEIRLMAGNLPPHSYWTLQFGANNLAVGLGVTVGKVLEKLSIIGQAQAQALARTLAPGFYVALVVAAVGLVILLLRRSSLMKRLNGIAAPARDFMIVGGAIIVGCHFAGQSVIYRGIFFLFILPGLAAMARVDTTRSGRWLTHGTSAAIILVLWAPALDSILVYLGIAHVLTYQGDPYGTFPGTLAGYGLWLVKELAWWWVMTILIATMAGTFLASHAWSTFRSLLARTD